MWGNYFVYGEMEPEQCWARFSAPFGGGSPAHSRASVHQPNVATANSAFSSQREMGKRFQTDRELFLNIKTVDENRSEKSKLLHDISLVRSRINFVQL